MKIAYLAQTYPPMISGQATVTQRLAEGMAARGHSVLVIAASEHRRAYIEEQANLRVVRLRSTGNPLRVGQRVLRWPWREVYEELLRFDPEVVHLHDPLHSALAGLHALRGRRVPTILTTHQLPWFVSNFIPAGGLQKFTDASLWRYARWLCRTCDAVIAPTHTIAKIVGENTGCHPQVISNGMDLEAFYPQPSTADERESLCVAYGLDPKLPIIVHVGQLNTQKQVDIVIRAAAQVMQNTDAQLLVVGDGKARNTLISLIRKLGIQSRSAFPGYVTDRLPAVYRLGSVFVTASEIETQGLVLLEAMASGLPVVAAQATCIPEIVREGINGYLVPPKDVASFARRIEQVLRDPGDMGAAGRSVALEHSFAATLERHEALYAGLIADRKRASRFHGYSQAIGKSTANPGILANKPSTTEDTPFTLFTQVNPFYEDLLSTIKTAQKQISMMYLTFDSGEWGSRLADVLCERAASGVLVRLMVDDIGLMVDDPRSAFRNRWFMNYLRQHGVQVDIFRPAGWRLSHWNRLHVKICAVDQRVAFVGGSNIGDAYLRMSDHNLRLDGELGTTFHDVYDYLRHHTKAGSSEPIPNFRPSYSFAGQAQVRLTVPGQRCDIRRALLDVILDAERDVYVREWYFLPDREILDALCSQARSGVAVNILFSHRTPLLPINIANTLHAHELAKSGARVYRFTEGFMHAKVAWNDQGQVLFGSANMDDKALRSNFECSLAMQNYALTEQLISAFESDAQSSMLQTPGYFRRLPLHTKALSYAFGLARPWL
jgi:glycosyltransferase involved in cell wall biosynthesis